MKNHSFSNHRRWVLFALAAFSFLGCRTTKESGNHNAHHNLRMQENMMLATLWQQHSGEYRALCFQAYNMAAEKLDHFLAVSRYAKPPCVVLDIDETVLDNSPYMGWEILASKPFDPATWYEWSAKAIADTVPGALGFLKHAHEKGVEAFYISNRDLKERDATLKNLQSLGFPDADTLHVLLKTESSNKESRRQQVLKTNAIVMLFGDNLNDFSDKFEKQSTENRNNIVDSDKASWGNNFIVLPNPMYGSWYSALLNYQKLNASQEDSVRLSKVQSFK
jgi:5'-nucleotidase (lipoprotein e(P4) family)